MFWFFFISGRGMTGTQFFQYNNPSTYLYTTMNTLQKLYLLLIQKYLSCTYFLHFSYERTHVYVLKTEIYQKNTQYRTYEENILHFQSYILTHLLLNNF